MSKMTITLSALALFALACGDSGGASKPAASGSAAPAASTQKPAATAKSSAGPTAPASASAATAETDEDIPTEADFEEEAEKDITAANMTSELDALEKEIAAEKP